MSPISRVSTQATPAAATASAIASPLTYTVRRSTPVACGSTCADCSAGPSEGARGSPSVVEERVASWSAILYGDQYNSDRSAVQGAQPPFVLRHHHAPLELERGRQHPVLLRERLGGEGEVLHPLEALPVGGVALQLAGEQLPHLGVLEQLRLLDEDPARLGPLLAGGEIRHQQRDVVRLVRAEHHRLLDERRERDLLLERRRRHVLAVLHLVELFDAAGDVGEAVGVEAPEIARAHADGAIVAGDQRLRGFVGEAVVALHGAGAVDEDLALV